MSENAILAALRRTRTILEEELQARPDIIEHQLAHAVRDPLGRAYNRTTHLPERRAMMQQWADYLYSLKSSGVNPLSPSALEDGSHGP